MLGNVTVVYPTMKSFQVVPSVVYSRETDGASPIACIAMVEFASSAVKVRPCYDGVSGSTVHPVGIAEFPVVVSLPS